MASINDDALDEDTSPDFEMEYVDISSVTPGSKRLAAESMKYGGAPSRARRIVKDGDILVSTVRTYLRAIAPVIDPPANLIASTGFAVIRPREHCSHVFLNYSLQAASFIEEVIARSTGVSYPAINAHELAFIKLPLPPLKQEQECIGLFLDTETSKIDALIEEQRRLIELLKEKRQAAISHAVTKGLNPDTPTKDSGSDWLGFIPNHWNSGVLVRCASRIVVGIAEAATHAYADEGVPILRSTNIRAGRIIGDILRILPEFAADRGSKLINSNDLITVRTGNAGVTAVVPAELDGCQCFTMLITSLVDEAVPGFYCYYINSDIAIAYFGVEGWGTAQVNISVPIPIPSKGEQEAIVRYLDIEVGRIDELTQEAEKVVSLLLERRSALISAAVTGKIDVRNYTPKGAA